MTRRKYRYGDYITSGVFTAAGLTGQYRRVDRLPLLARHDVICVHGDSVYVHDPDAERWEALADWWARQIVACWLVVSYGWLWFAARDVAQQQMTKPLFPELSGHWFGVLDGDERAYALYQRHYSARQYRRQRTNRLFVGPGEKVVLLTTGCDALFVWRKFIDDSGQQGINCAVFRNESDILASELIREAMDIAWRKWPGERLYTFVNAGKIKSNNPGYCFKKAGWRTCGETKGGLVILECLPQQLVLFEDDRRIA